MQRYRWRHEALQVNEIPSQHTPHFIVEERGGRRHRLYQKEYAVACMLDGELTCAQVAEKARAELGLETLDVDVDRFCQQLLALGFVEEID